MILLSEIVWLSLYLISIYSSILISDILLMSLSFFILGFSGIEFSIGIIISILFKNINESINLESNNKKQTQLDYIKNFKSIKNII